MQICRIKFFMLIKIQCRLRTFQKDVKIEYFISFSYISVQLFYHRYAQLFRCIFHRLVTFVFCIYEKSIFKDSLRFFKYWILHMYEERERRKKNIRKCLSSIFRNTQDSEFDPIEKIKIKKFLLVARYRNGENFFRTISIGQQH